MITNKINNILNNSLKNELDRSICNYIKLHLKEVSSMSIEELARETYVSKAKISNFIKNLGYDNYIAFKDDCLLELEIRKQATVSKYYSLDSFKNIERNLSMIDTKQIDAFVQAIKEANHIYLYGIAYSHLLCQYIQYEGDLFQKDILVLDENESSLILKDEDLLIVVGIEEDAISKHSSRYLRKLLRNQGKKYLLSTQYIDVKMLNYFQETLLLSIDSLEMKERRVMFHCFVDIMMARLQECA